MSETNYMVNTRRLVKLLRGMKRENRPVPWSTPEGKVYARGYSDALQHVIMELQDNEKRAALR